MQKTKQKNKLRIRERLMELFRRHIGENNAITSRQIFESIYGDILKYNQFMVFYMWSRIRNELNFLRRKTNCFVVNKLIDSTHYYFVVTNEKEAEYYKDYLDKQIRKMNYMKIKCDEAVKNKLYKKLLEEQNENKDN